ncbi:MAG: glycosyltransferase family 2 protein [Hyphomicrobiaceae bacterium]
MSSLVFDTMAFLIVVSLTASAVVLMLLVGVLAVELIAMLVAGSDREAPAPDATGSYVIVIPAHNEVGTIEHTLAAVLDDATGQGHVLVVADNCTDRTAAVARSAGATVIVRQDPLRRGKGYALDFAVRHLEIDPPDVVIVLDADCIPEPGALRQIFAACRYSNRPVQARYEMTTPAPDTGTLARVGAFAWRVRNVARPKGLAALGVPCLLMGTGMAFPWPTLSRTCLETGHLVEDMVLGLDLAARGEGARFFPEACVRGTLPPSREGQTSQRTRWETGHLQVIRHSLAPLLIRALARADYRMLVLALHALVPPLALLALLLLAVAVANGLVALAGGPSLGFEIAAWAACIAGTVFATYWFKMGRDILSRRELLQLPAYVVSKLSIYARAMSGRPIEWIRSKRD